MKIIKKKNNYEYDTDYNDKDILKLSKLIFEFLENKEKTNTKTLKQLIDYFYDVKLEPFDYVHYVNKKNNTHYYKVTAIPTQKVISDMEYEGHGRDFSWWTQNYQRMIEVASKEFTPTKDEYTFEEIQQLIDQGEIYPLYPFGTKTNKSAFNVKDNTKYLVSYSSKELEEKDEYFDFMVQTLLKDIGFKTLLDEIQHFIIDLKIKAFTSHSEDEEDFTELADNLTELYNKNVKNKQIKSSPVEIVVDYLRNLPYEDFWYEEINLDQIIKVIEELDYKENKETCDEIQRIAINLKEVELCYELAACFDWIDKKTMADIVVENGNPDFNYYFATEVEGADIERHKQVILNSSRADEYILERARKL